MPSVSSTSRKRRKPKGQNILDLVPERNRRLPFSVRDEPLGTVASKDPGAAGTVTIMVPRFKGALGQGFCRVFRVALWINVNLDAYGSLVWTAIDGIRTVRQLGEQLKERFGDDVEPLYGRLAEFLSLLERNTIIGYVNLHQKATSVRPPQRSGDLPRRTLKS
jgi:hypothetical protein